LTDWADGLWDIYHRHPWILAAAAAGPPADPGQLTWLNAGLAALGGTALSERDKLAAVMAVLHYVRGAAALNLEAAQVDGSDYPDLLRRVIDDRRFPALATALEAGAFNNADADHLADFHSGLHLLLDGVAARSAAQSK
ncbi:MAG: TetR/AcrR family transcriptional regulator C-terminal domain-containing protein, partial [Mycobacterium sp.]